MALDSVRSSHVIFFDSDDQFTEEFSGIVRYAKSETEPFDFLIFRHDDSRVLDSGGQGTFLNEESHWQEVGAAEVPTELTLKQAAVLCRLSAYPWNKIYRTDFLREHQIRCTEIPVHNDIELHWNSFIAARRILACTLSGATHFVQKSGDRLTNRRGAERLEVFHAFEHIVPKIMAEVAQGRLDYLLPFTKFSFRLINWIAGNIEDSYHPDLLIHAQRHFLASLDRNLMTMIAYEDPELARKINRLVRQGDLS